MPPAEVLIDDDLVRRLLRTQHLDLASLPLARFAEGWDNVTFRLGEAMLLRIPRRDIVGRQIVLEHTWLPILAPILPVAIPVPLRTGVPGEGYPWPWSVLPYLPGAPIDEAPLNAKGAADLGAFLRALHVAPPKDAPINPYRGGPLYELQEAFEARATRLESQGQLPAHVRPVWRVACEAPIDAAPTWLHGDLHPLNALSEGGRLTAVIDWIDVCYGDPATDLSCLWSLLDDEARRTAFHAYGGASTATVARAKGWAAYFGAMLLEAGLANAPRHADIGTAILEQLAP